MREVELAGRVLDEVRAVAGRRAEAEVLVESSTLALTRFARSYIHQNVADTGTVVRLRLHLDGRTATGSSGPVPRPCCARRTPAGRAWRRRPSGPGSARWTRRPRTPARPTGRRRYATSSTPRRAWRPPGTAGRCPRSRPSP